MEQLLQELKDLITKYETPVEPVTETQPEVSQDTPVESPVEPQVTEGEQVTQ